MTVRRTDDALRMRPKDTAPHRLAPIPVAFALVIWLAACGASGPPASTAPLTPAPDGVIELEETGDLRIVQGGVKVTSILVQQGRSYTFRITNTAGFAHDFRIASDAELSRGGGSFPGLEQFSSGTQEFSYTFETSGPLAFGCTVPGHYSLMKGSFTIAP